MNFLSGFFPALNDSLILLSSIVVCHFDANLAGILSSTLQWVPVVILASSRDDQILQIDPGFTYQISLFVVVEHSNLQSKIIWGFMDSETQLIVPIEVWPFVLALIVTRSSGGSSLTIGGSVLHVNPLVSSLLLCLVVQHSMGFASPLSCDWVGSSHGR